MIADGSKDTSVPGDLAKPLSLLTVSPGDGPNVAVRSISVSRGHQNAGGLARVELSGTGLGAAAISEVRVLDGLAVIGSATREWSGASTLTIDVPWWPIDTGARVLRIDVLPFEGEQTLVDNHVDIGVDVGATRSTVLVFDARPSWSSTFVRRAIEDDRRFAVGYRARLAPALSAGTANGRLDVAALDLASTAVIGGVDALTSGDVALLEQFVRVRGGTLILLPERAPAGTLVPLALRDMDRAPDGEARNGGRASRQRSASRRAAAYHCDRARTLGIISVDRRLAGRRRPHGHLRRDGRVALPATSMHPGSPSTALRASGFDDFWRSLIAEGSASGEGLQLTFEEPLSARGSRARFTLRDRRMAPAASTEASATARCGSAPATVIRVWPGGAHGEFMGELPLSNSGPLPP